MKPVTVFVKDHLYLHIQVKLAEKRFLQSKERPPTKEEGSVPDWHCTRCKKDEIDSTVDSSETDEIRRDNLVRQTRKAKKRYHRALTSYLRMQWIIALTV